MVASTLPPPPPPPVGPSLDVRRLWSGRFVGGDDASCIHTQLHVHVRQTLGKVALLRDVSDILQARSTDLARTCLLTSVKLPVLLDDDTLCCCVSVLCSSNDGIVGKISGCNHTKKNAAHNALERCSKRTQPLAFNYACCMLAIQQT